MPLEILAPMVVIGIALAWLLVRVLVNAPLRRIPDGNSASARFREDFPLETGMGEWLISDDGKVAVAPVKGSDALALVMAFGSKQLTRRLVLADIADVKNEEDHVLIRLNDFTLPEVRVQLPDTSRRDTLLKLLQSLQTTDTNMDRMKKRVTLS